VLPKSITYLRRLSVMVNRKMRDPISFSMLSP
jgi:hypothetical protein